MFESAIELEDVSKAYDKVGFKKKLVNALLLSGRKDEKVTALDHVSFRIRKGEIFGLLGPNGAGKTTMIKVLTTILTPDSGSARVNGFDVTEKSFEVKRSIGVLPEDSERGFFRRLSAQTNLLFYAREYTVANPKKRVGEVLRLVDLAGEDASKWFQKLSKGMKQKVALARALIPDSSVLFMDEPQRSLDLFFVSKLKELIRGKFGKPDRTVFLSSHDMHLIEETCDRVAIINKGRIVKVGRVSELKSLFRGFQTIAYTMEVDLSSLSSTEALARRLRGIEGVDHTKPMGRNKIEIRIKESYTEAINQILQVTIDQGYRILSLAQAEIRLDEIIMKLLKGV